MTTFASLKKRFDRSLFIVTGYMYDNGRREFLDDLIRVISKFYHHSDEWCSEYKPKSMRILEESNGTKLLHIGVQGHDCIFGTEIISEGVCSWKMRVNQLYYPFDDYWHLYVGVCKKSEREWEPDWDLPRSAPEKEGCYSFDVTVGKIVKQTEWDFATFNTKVTKSGDIIELTLDLENKKLSCKINDKDVEKSIENIRKGEYRLLVSLYFDKTELELL